MTSLSQNSIYFIIFLVACCSLSCSSEKKFKILSTLFDGVPEPESSESAMADSLAADSSTASPVSVATRRKQPEIFFHYPFLEKACDSCHGRTAGNQLNEEPPDLCYSCHDDFREDLRLLHGPVAGGLCTACHNPHRADYPKLLFAKGQDVCLKCHDSHAVFANEIHAEIEKTSCIECHNPHGGNEDFFL